jgi:DNA modification methylase
LCPLQLDVIERALTMWSNAGDLVLSPFTGIGSEGVASMKMGRRFVGTELKASYFAQAVQFLRAADRQQSLFEVGA